MMNDNFSHFGNRWFFADLRGFQSLYGCFILKEFCLINSNSICHKFVKPLLPIQKIKYFHRIDIEWQQKFSLKIPFQNGKICPSKICLDLSDTLKHKTVLVRNAFDEFHFKNLFSHSDQFTCIVLDDDFNFDEKTISNELDILPYCEFHNNKKFTREGKHGLCAKNNALRLRYILAHIILQKQKNDY